MLASARELDARLKAASRRTLLRARAGRTGGLAALVDVVAEGQQAVAFTALAAVPRMLLEQGVDADADAETRVRSLTYTASDGRSLDGLLDYAKSPEVTAQQFDRIVLTQLSDVARSASLLGSTVRPAVTGYVRMLETPSCSRCAVLAGKFYRRNAGFQRHPQCFPAGTMVSGPKILGATRRWYEGELVTVRTAGGQHLSMTGNHPVLTGQGWLPANLLSEGSDVVRRASGDRAVGLKVPDHDQVPSAIEDVWRAGSVDSLRRVPASAEDFHGDGVSGHVDVVAADGSLWRDDQPGIFEHVGESLLALRAVSPVALSHLGSDAQLVFGAALSSAGGVRSAGLLGSLSLSELGGPNQAGSTGAAKFHPVVAQSLLDYPAAHTEASRDGIEALAAEVGGGYRRTINAEGPSRWDAPAVPFSVESRVAYASLGNDLRLRLSGQVELDRVVEVTRIQWSGHVYNLTSAEGWFDADGLIVSNCDCRHIPSTENVAGDLRTDPDAYFQSLSKGEQDRVFTAAGAEAVRAGADVGQVVNARKGMSTAQTVTGRRRLVERDVFGRPMYTTTVNSSRARVRLMPESIVAMAGSDRADLLRLLKAHGYIA